MTTTHVSDVSNASKFRQFAHDIRSPLLSLEVLAKRAATRLDADQHRLMHMIIARLRHMADELLPAEHTQAVSATATAIHSPAVLVDRVVTAKWLELDSRPGVSLECRFGATAREARIAVNAVTLERVLSNLINNSLEAIATRGRVTVTLSTTATRALFLIEDSGVGFSPALLATLRAHTDSLANRTKIPAIASTKPTGHALGLLHAIEEIRALGGTLRFENGKNSGAAVSILLPLALPSPKEIHG